MRKEKKERYAKNTYCGIHTISGVAQEIVEQVPNEIDRAVKCSIRKTRGKDEQESYLVINPNKLYSNDRRLIANYKDFNTVFDHIKRQLKLNDFKINRADLAFNSDNSADYIAFQKLHRLLICCMAECYSFTNCYQSYDLWSFQSLNVAIKNDEYEIENYDKERESHGKDIAKNRLELRTKRVKKELEHEFLVNWMQKLRKAIECYERVQKRYNQELAQMWLEDNQKEPKDRKYLNLTAFLLQHKDSIFCNNQLVNLLSMIGVENPIQKARTFKKNHKIEYFSMSDLKFCVSVLNKKAKEYFSSKYPSTEDIFDIFDLK